ncbi:cation transporter [Frankia sp. CcI156]|uniref:cation diffusion facilitator family transporter n=1 Tax=unclassified Frankia TaxID=2632575 RepID=UPI0003CFCD42|nr:MULTISPECIES: cation diffusion facilitator family transporter [unclassified Frankia]OAA28844.1 cation diffusion facilitator family transporter [Frankia casuarinae]ETA00942.1 putative Co/Zn/Cd cation transporter [Frankia sp. CcI6]OFB45321.1 cation diffusion facilitator family transporter [Frankia sp. CgIM4]OHV57858.1 cation diffusion facilitator family transporter [Frankia sp. CgIS1]ONH28487.1 cation transporter [Frankia sp. CcI156]
MSTQGGTKAVMAALAANLGIALAKFVAFLVTQSSSMLAESIHSVADSGNQGLLLLGQKRSVQPPDEEHPFGYGRARYIAGFLVGIVLFSLGGLFSVYEGVEKLRHPHELESGLVAVVVLLIAVLLESYSFATAMRESKKTKGDRSWWRFIREARAPELPIVLLEDLAAELGLIFALLGVGLTLALDDPIWDGAGTLAIGVLLLIVAVIVATEAYGMLVGEAAAPAMVATIRRTLAAAPGVATVIHLRTLHLGPDELLVAAKIGIGAELAMPEVAATINGAEAALRAAVAVPLRIFLEPDILRDEPGRRRDPSAGAAGEAEPQRERAQGAEGHQYHRQVSRP